MKGLVALSSIIAVFCGCVSYGTGPQKLPPDVSSAKKSLSDTSCQNLSGWYVFYGEALPGYPSFFGLVGNRLAMDDMLGISLLPRDQRRKITAVEIIQNDSLEAIFHEQDGIASRKRAVSPEDRMSCQGGKLTIIRVREGVGEAVTGTATITETLSQAGDGSLVIKYESVSKDRSFIFRWISTEEYAASFRRLP